WPDDYQRRLVNPLIVISDDSAVRRHRATSREHLQRQSPPSAIANLPLGAHAVLDTFGSVPTPRPGQAWIRHAVRGLNDISRRRLTRGGEPRKTTLALSSPGGGEPRHSCAPSTIEVHQAFRAGLRPPGVPTEGDARLTGQQQTVSLR